MKYLNVTPFKNKRTGQFSIALPKKQMKKEKGDYLWVRVNLKGGKR
jgi:hypothetical protein